MRQTNPFELPNNAVWQAYPAVRLVLKLQYVMNNGGDYSSCVEDWDNLTPEEGYIIGDILQTHDDIVKMKGKSLKDAAEEGIALAQIKYASELLSNKRYRLALYWAHKAEQNMKPGAYGIDGFINVYEKCQNADFKKALDCLEMGVKLADPFSMQILSMLYKEGFGVDKDEEYAADLMECAEILGSAPCTEH